MSSRSLAVLGAAILCSLLTACGQPLASEKKTLNQQQADQRAEEHIQRAVAAVFTPPPRLERQLFITLECEDPTDLGPKGRVQVARGYWVRDLPKERNREYLDKLYEYWTRNGYRVLEDDRADPNSPALFVEHNDDGFRMSLQANFQGDLTISATSPCIWPTGEPT
ncbi:hypothetical protein [Carbonactinospora thermoautotrophica]|uniref:hypothetical protein n=1 Tax=Carbonactinospora thermoautotrophica TaxID=1469144 RepID=UPI0018E3B498|nr:hypothetical protein [Carbonactinospora thermoautotrophica]